MEIDFRILLVQKLRKKREKGQLTKIDSFPQNFKNHSYKLNAEMLRKG